MATHGVARDTYPHAADYVASLPAGLQSYPSARIKASLLKGLLGNVPLKFEAGTFPDDLVELLRNPPPPNTWVEEAKFVTLMLSVRDQIHRSDDEWLRWCKESNAAVFRSPLYRLLMYVATPEMALKGGAQRWDQFHQGTTLRATMIASRQCAISLSYPAHLFGSLYIRGLTTAFQAATEAAGGKQVRSPPPVIEESRARVELLWA